MALLGYAYRFLSNFVFLGLVYFSLNYLENYSQRAVVAIMFLTYALMRVVSAIRSFYFFHQIEKLETETRRLRAMSHAVRTPAEKEVSDLRKQGELKAYIDLLFLGMTVALCVAKILTE